MDEISPEQSSSVIELKSNSLSNEKNIRKSTQKKRSRRSPDRFGEFGELDLSSSFDDGLNLDDNSFDDLTFVPPSEDKETKVVATVRKIIQQPSKKLRLNRLKAIEPNSQADAREDNRLDCVNLDDEFDSTMTTTKEISCPTLDDHSEKNGIPSNSGAIESDELSNIDKTIDGKVESYTKLLSQNIDRSNKVTENKASDDILNVCQAMLREFREFSKETLARISIIEDAMLKNGTLGQADHKPSIAKNIEEIRIFELANHLPLKNINHLKTFEENLGDLEFRKAAVI